MTKKPSAHLKSRNACSHYDPATDIWSIHEKKWSGEALFCLATSQGETFTVTQVDGVTHLTRAHVLDDSLSDTDKRAKLANELERYNLWRSGAEGIEQPTPTELGILIDEVVKELRQ